ncbi:MAG: hypothetical protein FWH43_01240 [Endomicrobia bacterium]|nr:hypothetical protein [Endomicrobiia bacterium]
MKKVLALLFAVSFFAGSAFAAGGGEIVIKGGLGAFAGTTNPKAEVDGSYAENGLGVNIEAGKILDPFLKGEKGGKSLMLGAEYLYPINETFKIGAGMQYVSVSDARIALDLSALTGLMGMGDVKLSFRNNPTSLPLYATAQFNPAKEGALKGAFFKANLGYQVYYDNDFDLTEIGPLLNSILGMFSTDDIEFKVDRECSGGLYYGLGTGYEFDSGIILEVGYESFSGSVKHDISIYVDDGIDITTVKGSIETKTSYYHIGFKIGYRIAL